MQGMRVKGLGEGRGQEEREREEEREIFLRIWYLRIEVSGADFTASPNTKNTETVIAIYSV